MGRCGSFILSITRNVLYSKSHSKISLECDFGLYKTLKKSVSPTIGCPVIIGPFSVGPMILLVSNFAGNQLILWNVCVFCLLKNPVTLKIQIGYGFGYELDSVFVNIKNI